MRIDASLSVTLLCGIKFINIIKYIYFLNKYNDKIRHS